MQENIDIITRNFFKLMRSGAMNEYVELEPMSAFKWKKLIDVAISQSVASVASRAVKNHQFEHSFNMPESLRLFLHDEATRNANQNFHLELENKHLNKKLQKIIIQEKHSENFSKETLELFHILIANCHAILNKGTSMLLIIKLGNYIRINSSSIDFDKVVKWLKDMQMLRVASLVGTILINNFGFKKEELPFVKKLDTKAADTMRESIMLRRKESHNSGITYFEYAPLENASILLGRLKGRLDAIEE